jgi:hypothetical protein
MAVCGNAVWPSIAWAVQQEPDFNNRSALRVIVAIYSVVTAIIFAFNVHPTLRQWLDPVQEGIQAECTEIQATPAVVGPEHSRAANPPHPLSSLVSNIPCQAPEFEVSKHQTLDHEK